jgi:hypothetical protein
VSVDYICDNWDLSQIDSSITSSSLINSVIEPAPHRMSPITMTEESDNPKQETSEKPN